MQEGTFRCQYKWFYRCE